MRTSIAETPRGEEPVKAIVLSKGATTIVDAEDYDWLTGWNWRVDNKGYATRQDWNGGEPKEILMHRLIISAPAGVPVDHIDRNPLNNTKANLRFCTPSQNQGNSDVPLGASGYRGVTRSNSRWKAKIKKFGEPVYLGTFDTPEKAARTYDRAALEHFGEFASLNFPEGGSNA